MSLAQVVMPAENLGGLVAAGALVAAGVVAAAVLFGASLVAFFRKRRNATLPAVGEVTG